MRIDDERAQLAQLARAIYTAPTSVLVILAQAQSLSDLLTPDRRPQRGRLARGRAQELARAATSPTLQAERAEGAGRARRAGQAARTSSTAELAQLQALQAQQEKSMAAAPGKIDQTQTELYLLSRQSAQLAQQVTDMLQQQQDAIIAAAMQSVWTQVQLWTQSNNVGQIPTSAGHSTKYRFIWPEPQAQISQGFGPSTLLVRAAVRRLPALPHRHRPGRAVRLAGLRGRRRRRRAGGQLQQRLRQLRRHRPLGRARHAVRPPLDGRWSRSGSSSTQGQPIGLEGSTGNSTGPHLHFELRINQKPIDPAPYLPPGPPSAYKV